MPPQSRCSAVDWPRGVWRYDTIVIVRSGSILLLILASALSAQTPAAEEDFHVYRDAPRILLTPDRLRLLQREPERQSLRWEQFKALMSGGAAIAEPGFANALFYRAGRDAAAGRKAVEWALGDSATDLRQLALVFDWCGPVLTPGQADRLAGKIERGMAAPASPASSDVRRQSARVLAAIALADRLPDQSDAILREIVQKWWRGQIVPQLVAGKPAVPREQLYALYEMFHALRDNLKIDLREQAADHFKQLPMDYMAGHYPAPMAAPENDFRVPAYLRDGAPDLTEAVLSRAAGLAMVAYDNNAQDSQYLQGWLLLDRYLMRGSLGIVYEFLWANPYQPGLGYDRQPLVFHDPLSGHVFARTSWDDDATWIGYFEGRLQLFQNGQLQTLKPGAAVQPLRVGDAVLTSAPPGPAPRFHLDGQLLIVLGLMPRAEYGVEIDDQELEFVESDAGGTLVISGAEGVNAGVRINQIR
jgi:hypothetical protein